jgi:hypothetical protein
MELFGGNLTKLMSLSQCLIKETTMLCVYISGPITRPTKEEERANVEASSRVASWCVRNGMAVYWPHGTWYMDQITARDGMKPIEYDFLPQDFEWIKRCDAMLVLPGKSVGVLKEIRTATEYGVPVFRLGILYDDDNRQISAQRALLQYKQEWDGKKDVCNSASLKVQSIKDGDFATLLNELQELHDRKSQDYANNEDPLANLRGAEDYGLPAWIGTQFRLDDKHSRIKKAICGIIKSGNEPGMANESLEDSLLDRCVYSIIALQFYRERNKP